MKELYKVLKDHKNPMIQELAHSSYEHCAQNEMESLPGCVNLDEVGECGTENAVRVCLVNPSFNASLQVALKKLEDAKLIFDQFGFHVENQDSEPGIDEAMLSDKLTVLVNDIGIAMKRMDYALYRGKIYKKRPNAKYAFSYKCEVKAFINCLAANEFFKARLLKDMRKVIDILSDPDCEVIRPICVDYNLIEVNSGECWSIEERKFLKNAIPEEKIGLMTPRAFTKFDPRQDPDPKYFREILQNSLTEAEIGSFCEDFLKLLNFNKKRHKDRVPCPVGDANSGKTSLFQPILGLVHHSNIATVTKQRVFNKAMITQYTEVIFVDEASTSTMDIDDWKILTQGGFTACDVKYQTARSFINRCPMLITAQQELQFKPEDQPAMDRRLRIYSFKSLPAPKKGVAGWLRRNPMHCVVWAAAQARVADDEDVECESTDDEDGLEIQVDQGTLPEHEKEALRTMVLGEVLVEPFGEVPEVQDLESSSDNADVSDQGPSIDSLKRMLKECSPMSLRHRQLSKLLDAHLQEISKVKDMRTKMHESRKRHLMSRGVTWEHLSLLPEDREQPLPTPIERDLAAFEQTRREEELQAAKKRAKDAYQAPWLQSKEKELHECAVTLWSAGLDRERRASLEAYEEVLQDHLKNHLDNLGLLRCQYALEERKRTCVALGLLRKEHQHMVTSLVQTLPTMGQIGESSQANSSRNDAVRISDDEAELFITPAPSTSYSPSPDPRRDPQLTSSARKRRRLTQSQVPRGQRSISNFFHSQN